MFWVEFCERQEMRETVIAIANGQPWPHRPSFERLKEHSYIVEKEGTWRLRVPLFETWVRRFGYVE